MPERDTKARGQVSITQEDLDLRKRVGANVRLLLHDRQKSVASLARDVFHVTPTTMHNRLSGKHKLSTDDLGRIAAYLDLDDIGALFRQSLLDQRISPSAWMDILATETPRFDLDLPAEHEADELLERLTHAA